MPSQRTVYRWLAASEEFRQIYTRAKEDSADTLTDQIIDIADDGRRDYTVDEDGREVVDHDHINRARLRVDARKWIASKLKPKKYGDLQRMEVSAIVSTREIPDDISPEQAQRDYLDLIKGS